MVWSLPWKSAWLRGDWEMDLEEDFLSLAEARPTAANLFWALNRMRERLLRVRGTEDVLAALEAEAIAIHESDREANLTMAQHGIELIRRHQGNEQALLTYGNAGALASGGIGTALGVIRAGYLEGWSSGCMPVRPALGCRARA